MRAAVVATVCFSTACGLGLAGTSASDGGTVGPSDAAVSDAPPLADGEAPPDAGTDADAATKPSQVYAHTDGTLYRLDPIARTYKAIGPVTGCSSLTDIAVDRQGKIVGVGAALYSIDPTTGACQTIATPAAALPFTLAFVPKGTLDPNDEALVAYAGSSYVRVDRQTGNVTVVNSTAISPYVPSGDVVSVEGVGTFVAVIGGAGSDLLLQVDPSTGSITKNWGSIGKLGVYGLAYGGGQLFGFAGNGDVYAITLGAPITTTTITPATPIAWVGAGSPTL